MKYLQVVKTPPGPSTSLLLEALARGQDPVTRFNLYEDDDYGKLVELIFANDYVQSWW